MTDVTPLSELEVLRNRADKLGIKYHHNTSIDTLRDKIKDVIGAPDDPNSSEVPTKSLREMLVEQETALVRIRISNNNPQKKDLQGEVFTVDNAYIGTIRKYVPYGAAMDVGYHVPNCILTMLREREFLRISTRKDSSGKTYVETRFAPEFSIEVLPPLTPDELATLAKTQAASGSVE